MELRPGGQRRIRRAARTAVLVACIATLVAACSDEAPRTAPTTTAASGEAGMRLDQLQWVGTHNSYHVAPQAEILDAMRAFVTAAPELKESLGDPASLDYTHAPLPTQLERGIRTFELDIVADPEGGRFASPRAPQLVALSNPVLPSGMDQPGFKVIHIPDIDYISTCPTLQACLGEIVEWSEDHPRHLPIVINLELKGDALGVPDDLGFAQVVPIDAAQLDAVDGELRRALGDRLIEPDDVRGDAADLRTAITRRGWPLVSQSRGKVLVFMDNADLRDAYLEGHDSLRGRAMFTSSGEGAPDGAILKENDPGDGSRIRSLVEAGYLVRTRADDDPAGPLPVAQRDTALSSGAQIVHTDFPTGEPHPSGYVVSLGSPVSVRCNPVTARGDACRAADVSEPTG